VYEESLEEGKIRGKEVLWKRQEVDEDYAKLAPPRPVVVLRRGRRHGQGAYQLKKVPRRPSD